MPLWLSPTRLERDHGELKSTWSMFIIIRAFFLVPGELSYRGEGPLVVPTYTMYTVRGGGEGRKAAEAA